MLHFERAEGPEQMLVTAPDPATIRREERFLVPKFAVVSSMVNWAPASPGQRQPAAREHGEPRIDHNEQRHRCAGSCPAARMLKMVGDEI